ncbi:MAG: type secretion system sortase PorU [Bacteroidota bacterium]
MKRWVLFLAVLTLTPYARGQKNYVSSSVLSTGKWVKVAAGGQGIFKVTGSFLNQAGFSGSIATNSIRLFGHGGGVLPESNQVQTIDDLPALQIEVVDGGDGMLDKDDYFLFYCPGTNQWSFNKSTQKFEYIKNPYSDISYFFIQVGQEQGARLGEKVIPASPTVSTDQFTEHIRFERDSFNFLNSGREWYGEAFGNEYPSARSFQVATEGAIIGSRFECTSEVVGRSFDNPNKLAVSINGKALFQHNTPAVIGTLLEPIANVSRLTTEGIVDANAMAVRYDFTPGSANGQSWLNWFEVVFRKSIKPNNDSFFSFRDPFVVGSNQIAAFNLASSNPNLKIWEVTERGSYSKLKTEFVNNQYRFKDDANVLKEYIAFDPQLAKQPILVGVVANQNLHGDGFYDMVIVADPSMLSEAKRLAQFRTTKNGLRVLVTDPMSIYNEFSSGSTDPSAIRNFLKMLYDRAGTNPVNRPKFLLLFGGTSFRYKEQLGDKKNLIPSYQTLSSLDPLTSYVSDDFFGYLDDADDINTNLPAPLLDIAVGRIPARTVLQAKMVVDKIITYQTQSDFGPWRNELTFVADDEDFDLHFKDAEAHAAIVEQGQKVWNLNKIYLDAFEQSSGTGGSRYPDVNASITKGLNQGTLVWNYSGHGGNVRLAQEAILEKEMIPEWQNQKRLPLFVTATCDFAPFDNPTQFSIGEDLFLGRTNGAIGLMTTTRLVFASSNKLMNNNFLQALLQKNGQGLYPTLGEAWLRAKNNTVSYSGDFINARKFAMLGDPSMKLLMPEYQVATSKLLDAQTGLVVDTLRALNKYTIQGEVLSPNGGLAGDFNGRVYVSIHDKATNYQTRANDPQSSVKSFKVFDNLIYYGKAQVQSGKFSIEFIVPNDIRFDYGNARISYYAEDGARDAQGVDETIVAGGFGGQVPNDKAGPQIQTYLENENFKNGGVVSETPLLIVKLSDQSGIYLGSFGIGHDIRLVIDGNYASPLVLNDFFEPALGQNKAGEIRLRLPKLTEGVHKIEIKAWDVFNNSSVAVTDFSVVIERKIAIDQLYNFPNPFNQSTNFMVLLNGKTEGAYVQLDIFTMEGKPIKRIEQAINQSGLRSLQLNWSGNDENGKRPQPGIYFSRFSIKAKTGEITTKLHKLILL